MKNIVISNRLGLVLFLSMTYEGSVHDKKIADEEDYDFGESLILLQDTGFQGYNPSGAVVIQPTKKPKNKALTEEQKLENKLISSIRIFVEHSIRSVKIWRIAKDVCRYHCPYQRDLFMELACGLSNFRITHRATRRSQKLYPV